jgi:hypothetical protein
MTGRRSRFPSSYSIIASPGRRVLCKACFDVFTVSVPYLVKSLHVPGGLLKDLPRADSYLSQAKKAVVLKDDVLKVYSKTSWEEFVAESPLRLLQTSLPRTLPLNPTPHTLYPKTSTLHPKA